jgi:hypothetical protein
MKMHDYEMGLREAAKNGPTVWNEQIEYARMKGYDSIQHLMECVTDRSAEWIAGYAAGIGEGSPTL